MVNIEALKGPNRLVFSVSCVVAAMVVINLLSKDGWVVIHEVVQG